MKIKTKLTLGVGLLFLMIIIVSIVGAFNINALKNDTENILTANYNSLEYCRTILDAIENKTGDSWQNLERDLNKQEQNITEIGEAEATEQIRINFEQLKLNPENFEATIKIRNAVFTVMDMNMEAIQRKSDFAQQTANKAMLWIGVSGTLCFLIAFVLLVNLPSNIANPIKSLSESIKQIADKNYSQRVHFESHSEYGQLAKSFNTMAKKLEEYNNSNLAKLMMEKKRIETLINKMHDPVIGLDENLQILFANEEASKITGLKQDDLIGKSSTALALKNDLIRALIRDLVLPNDKQPVNTAPIKIFAENKESYFEKETIDIAIVPTGEHELRSYGHVIFLRNVTSYKELDSAKTNFIATVSHEFKTPIASIKMSLQLLENEQIGKLNQEQLNLIDSIKDDANRLLKITGELLNMTQVESGNIQLSLRPEDPKEIVSYALNATRLQAEQKQIKIDFICRDNMSKVIVDIEKTAWVVTNLVSNALRYSYDNSSILIKLEETQNQIQLSVKDAGQGIAPQYQHKIFDRYFRVPGTNKEGTGLGLAISKELIEAQGGEIRVESEFGAGSTFLILLNKAI